MRLPIESHHDIGLDMVKRVKRAVTRMGGRVGVESKVGEGSVFTVVLPGEPTFT
ncbi:MAG TPA: hypothetical protein VJU18_16985 [Vicinamibacteria bacterium]|nr:hypothetical protein [Vicinamibacteria bacterium]